MELGKRIASLRKRKKITQTQLAEYLMVQPQTISRWEVDGGTPDVTLLPRIAVFFGISMDELFGMTDLEQIDDLVYKYSVLRDERSYEEVMRVIDTTVELIEEELRDDKKGGREELKGRRQQLLAWKVHIFIQRSRKAMEDAESLLDQLREEITDREDPLYWPLTLQKQQFRIQGGEARKTLEEAREGWRKNRDLGHLHCCLAALLETEQGEEILRLWEQSEARELVSTVTKDTEPLWEMVFSAARMEKDLPFFLKCFEHFQKRAGEQAVFEAEWELFRLYDELQMREEKEACRAALTEKLGRLDMNEYMREMYREKAAKL